VKESTHCASSALSTHFFSADGKDWQCADVEPYGHTVPYTDGNHTYTTLERPNILFDSAGQMTHLVLAADLVTGDEGCAAHGRCRRGEKPPCATACTNCKYTDHAGTIVVALKSDDTTPPAAAQEDGWTLAWSDDFNGTVLDGSKWTVSDNFTHSDYTYKPGSSTELQLYVKSAVRVEGGSLRLTTKHDPETCKAYGNNGRNHTSGWVDSKQKFSQAFGRFEVRAKLPNPAAVQIWPALWMMPEPELTHPTHLCWPAGGEIDIMEMWGGHNRNESSSTLHYTAAGGSQPKECGGKYDKAHGHIGSYPPANLPPVDFSQDFHIWELIWSPTSMVFNLKSGSGGTVHKIGEVTSKQATLPQTPFYWIFNTAICGAKYCEVPHEGGLVPEPVEMEIDFVRVYTPAKSDDSAAAGRTRTQAQDLV
jgi:beta-glucanase (GH16 family)